MTSNSPTMMSVVAVAALLVCLSVQVAAWDSVSCASATSITVPSTQTGNTLDSNPGIPYAGRCDGGNGEYWYGTTAHQIFKFPGTNAVVTASLCSGSDFDTRLFVLSSPSGTNLCDQCIWAGDDNCNLFTSYTFPTSTGTDYYILVTGYSDRTGNYNLVISVEGVPPAWNIARCPIEFYDDGLLCNCGCGAIDPDCNDYAGGTIDAVVSHCPYTCEYNAMLSSEIRDTPTGDCFAPPAICERAIGFVAPASSCTQPSSVPLLPATIKLPEENYACYAPSSDCSYSFFNPTPANWFIALEKVQLEAYIDSLIILKDNDADNAVYSFSDEEILYNPSSNSLTVLKVTNATTITVKFTSDSRNNYEGALIHVSLYDEPWGRKEDCSNHGHFVGGVCLCDFPWSGLDCSAVNCGLLTTCTDCLEESFESGSLEGEPQCRFCKGSSQCMPYNASDTYPSCPDQFDPTVGITDTCPCEVFTTCRSCLSRGSGCGWCFDSGVGDCRSGTLAKPHSTNCIDWMTGAAVKCPTLCQSNCLSRGSCQCSSSSPTCVCSCFYSYKGTRCENGIFNTWASTFSFDPELVSFDGTLSAPAFLDGTSAAVVSVSGKSVVVLTGARGDSADDFDVSTLSPGAVVDDYVYSYRTPVYNYSEYYSATLSESETDSNDTSLTTPTYTVTEVPLPSSITTDTSSSTPTSSPSSPTYPTSMTGSTFPTSYLPPWCLYAYQNPEISSFFFCTSVPPPWWFVPPPTPSSWLPPTPSGPFAAASGSQGDQLSKGEDGQEGVSASDGRGPTPDAAPPIPPLPSPARTSGGGGGGGGGDDDGGEGGVEGQTSEPSSLPSDFSLAFKSPTFQKSFSARSYSPKFFESSSRPGRDEEVAASFGLPTTEDLHRLYVGAVEANEIRRGTGAEASLRTTDPCLVFCGYVGTIPTSIWLDSGSSQGAGFMNFDVTATTFSHPASATAPSDRHYHAVALLEDPTLPDAVILVGGAVVSVPSTPPALRSEIYPPLMPDYTSEVVASNEIWVYSYPATWQRMCRSQSSLQAVGACESSFNYQPRYGHTVVIHGGFLFIFGGFSPQEGYAKQDFSLELASRLDYRLEFLEGELTAPPRMGHTSTLVYLDASTEPVVLDLGGYVCEEYGNVTDCTLVSDTPMIFNLQTLKWATLTVSPSHEGAFIGRAFHSAVFAPASRNLLVYGGEVMVDGERKVYGDIQVFSCVHRVWKSVMFNTFPPTILPLPRSRHSAVWVARSRDMIVFGGVGVDGGALTSTYTYHHSPVITKVESLNSTFPSLRPTGDYFRIRGDFGGFDLSDSRCALARQMDRASSKLSSINMFAEDEILTASDTEVICRSPSIPRTRREIPATLVQREQIQTRRGPQWTIFYAGTEGLIDVGACPPGTSSFNPYYWDWEVDYEDEDNPPERPQACPVCPKGTFSEDGLTCERCPPGQVQPFRRRSDCNECEPGTVASDSGLEACTPCPRGTASNVVGGIVCLPCTGQYSDVEGATACLQCPANSASLAELPTSISDCKCAPGFWGDIQKPGDECTQCTKEMQCVGSGTLFPYPAEGYWRASNDSLIMFECVPSDVCISTFDPNSLTYTEACREGHTDRMCSKCLDGYFENDGYCSKCPEGAQGWRLILASFGGVVLLSSIMVMAKREGENVIAVLKDSSKLSSALASLPISISFFQTTAVFANFKLDWPMNSLNFMSVFSTVNIDFKVAKPECAIPMLFYKRWVIQMWIPIIIFCVLVLVTVIGSIVMYIRDKSGDKRKAAISFFLFGTTSTMTLASLGYIFMSSLALQLFDCTPQDDGTYSLDAEPYLYCYDEEWRTHLGFGIFGIIFYVIAIPLTFAVALVAIRRPWRGTRAVDVNTTVIGASLSKKYEPKLYFWEMTIMARKLAVVLAAMFFSSRPIVQTLVAISVFFISLMITTSLRPYFKVRHDIQELSLLTSSFLLLFSGILFSSTEDEDIVKTTGTIIMVILSLSSIIVGVCLVLEIKDKVEEFRAAGNQKSPEELERERLEWEQRLHRVIVKSPIVNAHIRHFDEADYKRLLEYIEKVRGEDVDTDEEEAIVAEAIAAEPEVVVEAKAAVDGDNVPISTELKPTDEELGVRSASKTPDGTEVQSLAPAGVPGRVDSDDEKEKEAPSSGRKNSSWARDKAEGLQAAALGVAAAATASVAASRKEPSSPSTGPAPLPAPDVDSNSTRPGRTATSGSRMRRSNKVGDSGAAPSDSQSASEDSVPSSSEK